MTTGEVTCPPQRLPARRPTVEFDGRRLPVPWILGEPPDIVWTDFDTNRSTVAYEEQRCQVCGEPTAGGPEVLLRSGPTTTPRTSGSGCHPHCARLAVATCPHLATFAARGQLIGWWWDGDGPGYTLTDPAQSDTPEAFETAEAAAAKDAYSDDPFVNDGAVAITADELDQYTREHSGPTRFSS